MQMTGEDRPDLRRIISENDFRLSEPDIVVDVKPGIWTDALYSQSFVPLKGGWRGLSPKFIEYFRIRYDSYSKRIMFPIHDKYGRIVGVKGRTTVDDSIKYKLDTTISSVDPKRLGVWFGMHIPISGSQLFIVESEIDAMLLIQNGVDAWASMSASITNQQIKSLAEVRVPIVLAFDNDYAGMAARSKVLNDLCGIVKIKIVLDYFDCKDVAEIIENRRLSTFLESVNSNKFWC
jgi:DNA primase